MLKVHKHTFNPFQENTYIIEDETKECVIIDPGCSNERERNQLVQTIEAHGLKPVKLLNTHCHIDHFPGNKFVCETYNLLPEFHEVELQVMYAALDYQTLFGFKLDASPEPKHYLKDGDEVKFGNTTLSVIFTPGHSPGSLSFYNETAKTIISGDVLFRGSVGRYDLPGASGEVLFKTIMTKLMTLPDDVKVYSGHGPETFIGVERRNNPFLKDEVFFG
ncbi:MAG TPA: MBL fold metallo-hydrolase [Chitinophagales bacterium]|nr:MBL fold metallo-hydrolase [Chitinophagales bacterium]